MFGNGDMFDNCEYSLEKMGSRRIKCRAVIRMGIARMHLKS